MNTKQHRYDFPNYKCLMQFYYTANLKKKKNNIILQYI